MRIPALLLLLCAACSSVTVPADAIDPGEAQRLRIVESSARLDAPTVFAEWWDIMERCSGLTGDLSRIEWYEAPVDWWPEVRNDTVVATGVRADALFQLERWGFWEPGRVVLVRGFPNAPLRNEPFYVRHFMLHALLGTADHPDEYFLVACGYALAVPYATPHGALGPSGKTRIFMDAFSNE